SQAEPGNEGAAGGWLDGPGETIYLTGAPAEDIRTMTLTPQVRSGLSVLRDQAFAPLRGRRVGLATHAAAVNGHLRHALDRVAEARGVRLAALFGPDHGLLGTAQALVGVADGADLQSGLRVHSLYGATFASLKPTAEHLRGLDALVIDLQDVGSRYYTF